MFEQGPPGAPQPTFVPLSDLVEADGYPMGGFQEPIYGQVGTMQPQYGQIERRNTMQVATSIAGEEYKGNHIPLAKCRVLYLGSAVPLETSVGLESVQNPLKERYPYQSDGDVAGIDAWLTVFSSGLLAQYVGDKSVVWFPIQTLHVCAAVKCATDINGVTGEKTARFVALDSPSGKTTRHPPIFAAILRRTQGVKVLECHGFICKSNQAALALVHSCTHAYDHKEGWTDDAPTGELLNSRLVAADPAPKKVAPPEFFEKPPAQGYFYTSNRDLIRNYNVFGNNADEYKREEYRPPSELPMRRPSRALLPPEPRRPPSPRMERRMEPRMERMEPRMEMIPRPRMGPPPPQEQYMPPPDQYTYGYDVPPPIFMPSMQPPMLQPEMIIPPPPPPQFMETYDPYFAVPPPVPEGYFNNWDVYGGQPVAIFPTDPYQGQVQYEGPPRRRRRRRKRSQSPRRMYPDPYQPAPYQQPPPVMMEPPPPQVIHVPVPVEVPVQVPVQVPVPYPVEVPRRSYSPAYSYGSYGYDYYDYDYDDYDDRRQPDRRARRDDYDRQPKELPRQQDYYDPYYRDDLMMYAPRYMRSIPDDRRRNDDYAQYAPRQNPEVRMKETRDYRREREYDPYDRNDRDDRNDYEQGYDKGYEDRDYDRYLPKREESRQQQRYPRGDRGFAKSIGEERRLLGDGYGDPYDDPRRNYFNDRDSHLNYDMFRRPTENLERSLGYLP